MMRMGKIFHAALLLPISVEASTGTNADLAGSMVQMLASLFLVIGIILLLYYAINRLMKAQKKGSFRYIRVVETRYLAPKKALVLVEVAGEYLLLSSSGDSLSYIKQVEMLEEIDVMDERGYTSLIPSGLKTKLKGMKMPSVSREPSPDNNMAA